VFAKRLRRRPDNVRRTIRLNLDTFRGFAKSTVARQRSVRGRGPVRFIPFGPTPLLTVDIWTMLRASLKACPRTKPLSMQLATVGAMCQLWTDRWVKVLGAVPAPVTAAYRSGLRARLRTTIERKEVIGNKKVQGCNSKSLLGETRKLTKREQASRVEDLVAGVEAVAERAMEAAQLLERGLFEQAVSAMHGPGLEGGSYLAKFLPAMLIQRRTPGAPRSAVEKLRPSISCAGGVIRAVARLCALPEDPPA